MHSYYRAILQSLAAYAQNSLNFSEAMHLFQQLATAEKEIGNPEGKAGAYHQLGMIAQEQRDFQTAEKWYRKSLEIEEKQGNEHGAAMTYGQLGILFRLKEEYELSGRWLIRSIQGFANTGDDSSVQQGVGHFVTTYKAAPDFMHDKLESMWTQAGFGDFGRLINSQQAHDPVS
jgi:tetratricopeptide (TPR) repeat protein